MIISKKKYEEDIRNAVEEAKLKIEMEHARDFELRSMHDDIYRLQDDIYRLQDRVFRLEQKDIAKPADPTTCNCCGN